MSLNPEFAFLSPVQFVKVTKQNMEEVAEWCGGKVAKIESRRKPGTMDDYVWVPTPDESKTSSAFPGYYVTKRIVMTAHNELKVTWAVFAGRYFDKNYFDSPLAAVDATWAKKEPKAGKPEVLKPEKPAPVIIQNIYQSGNLENSAEEIYQGTQEALNQAQLQQLGRDASL